MQCSVTKAETCTCITYLLISKIGDRPLEIFQARIAKHTGIILVIIVVIGTVKLDNIVIHWHVLIATEATLT